jgi:hypothetical protein
VRPKRRVRQNTGWHDPKLKAARVLQLSCQVGEQKRAWIASWAFYVNGLETREYEGR